MLCQWAGDNFGPTAEWYAEKMVIAYILLTNKFTSAKYDLMATYSILVHMNPSSFHPQSKMRWFLFGVAWRASAHRIQFLTIRANIHGKACAVFGLRPQVKLNDVNADIIVTVVVAEMILKINILRTLNDNDVMTNEPLTNSPEIIMYFKQTTWFTLSCARAHTHREYFRSYCR